MNSSPDINNNIKDILILAESPKQRLEHTLTPEKMSSISFTENNKTCCLG